MTSYQNLEAKFRQINRLNDLRSIAGWDEAVMMPTGSGEARGQAMAELSSLIQNMIAHSEVRDWLHEASAQKELLNPWQQANLGEIRRQFVEATAIPPELNQRLVLARMQAEQLWRRLRAENDYNVNLKAELEIRSLHDKIDHIMIQKWNTLITMQEMQLRILEEQQRERE